MMWRKYYDLEPIRRLRNEGRELIGQFIDFTEKRDGENVSLWCCVVGMYTMASRPQRRQDRRMYREE